MTSSKPIEVRIGVRGATMPAAKATAERVAATRIQATARGYLTRMQALRHQKEAQRHTGSGGSHARGDAGGDGSGGEYDSSLVCTREAGGVQRRVAEVLLGSIEFGVRSLEQYNHHSALSSVLYS